MKFLSQSDFERRNAELIEAKGFAEAAHRAACFALETESGTEADVKKAKGQIDLIVGKITGLANAFQESERLRGQQNDKALHACYAAMVESVDEQLKIRERALAELVAAGEAASKALKEHAESTTAIRVAAGNYVRQGSGSYGPTGHSRMSGLNMALERGSGAAAIFSAVLDLGGVPLASLMVGRDALYGASSLAIKEPTAIEADRSLHVRRHVEFLAPEGEMA